MEDINGCLNSDIWSASYNQKQYGCHRPHVPFYCHKPKYQECVYCRQMQPASLEDLALYKVLKESQLVQKVDAILSHMPDRLCAMIGRAINANYYGKALKLVELMPEDSKARDSLFDVKPSNRIMLSRFLFYSNVYHKLKLHCTEDSSDVANEILTFLRNMGRDYREFWSNMNSMMKRFVETMKTEEMSLLNKNAISTGDANIVYVNTPDLFTSDDKLNLHQAKQEYKSMKDLQKLNKITCLPVIFRTRCIVYPCLKAREIPFLLEYINPRDITNIDLTVTASWSVDKICNLGQVLSECCNLSSFCLWQEATNTETPENLALAMSKLFSYHSHLLKIKLGGIPFGGTMEQYPLPSAKEWFLSRCDLIEADWKSMASRTDLALKALTLSSECSFTSHPSLPNFIQMQASSLEKLLLQDLSLMSSEVCNMVNKIAPFNQLQELHLNCDNMDGTDLENLVFAFMSITSAKKLFCEMSSPQKIFEEQKMHLNQAMKKFCAANRRAPIFLSTTALSPMIVTTYMCKWDD